MALVGVTYFLFSPIIFQEGNPWPQIKGMAKLSLGKEEMVKLSASDDKYMSPSSNGQEIIKSFMKDRGYDFTEQMGSGYMFKSSSGESAIATHRYYSRYYSLWNITENKYNLAEELKNCLPKSDTESHEKCNELLKQITDYNSCVKAGFPIMKSNPPQCMTIDNQTFIQNI